MVVYRVTKRVGNLFFSEGANSMKKEIKNQACENNAEVEKDLEQVSVPAEEAKDENREWWLSVKYSDSPFESDR
jgi:hypothetical protein